MKILDFCGVLLLACGAAGCAGRAPLVSTSELTVVEGAMDLPPPDRADLTAEDRSTFVGPLDRIQVDVFNVPELTREIQVDGSGRISLPLLGTLEVGGSTAAELAAMISSKLRGRYVREPDVTVNIVNSASQVVTVDGQVKEPGLYPVSNQTTLLRAIAQAKGFDEFARLDDVVILRTVQNRRMAALYNVASIRRGLYADPPVYANDIVVVGDSPQRRLFRDLIALSPVLAAPLVTVLQ